MVGEEVVGGGEWGGQREHFVFMLVSAFLQDQDVAQCVAPLHRRNPLHLHVALPQRRGKKLWITAHFADAFLHA